MNGGWTAVELTVGSGAVRVVLLLVAGIALVALTVATARRPDRPIPDLGGYLDRWQALHGGYDPRTGSVWLRGWLTLSFHVARPLARRGVSPDVMTLWTLWLALAVFVPAAAGGRWPLLAAWTLVLSGLGDTLDGCVAVLTDRTTRWGYVLDSGVDRVNDLLYLAAVVSVGAPVALAVVTGIAFFLLEYLRARSANAGGGEIGAVTVGERANRVVLTAVSIFFGGVFVAHAELVATLGLAALMVLSLAGLGQLVVAIRARLAGLPQ